MKISKCENSIRPTHLSILRHIQKAADQAKTQCFAVGGFVRDCLTNKNSDDLDVVCLDIDTVSDLLIKKGIAKNITSEKGITNKTFRTNILIFEDEKVDFVEPRKELYTLDSIKPIVTKGNIEDDTYRRDFTINTLQLGLSSSDWMKIYDRTGKGLSDLKNNILQTPRDPEVTFLEDPSRMLRAVRFSSCYNLQMTPDVSNAIKKLSTHVLRVSSELIHKELMKGAKCDNYYRKLYDVGLLKEIIPESIELKGITQNPIYHTTDALEHTFRTIDNLPNDSIYRTAGLFHDLGKADTMKLQGNTNNHEKYSVIKANIIGKRLKFPKQELDQIQYLVDNHMQLHYLSNDSSDTAYRKFIQKHNEHIPKLIVLTRADIISDNPNHKKAIKEFDTKIEKITQIQKAMEETQNTFKLAINGNDIMKYGWKGKEIQTIKNHLQDLILDNQIPNTSVELNKYLDNLKTLPTK